MRYGVRATVTALSLALAGACSSLTDAGSMELIRADRLEARAGAGIIFLSMRIAPEVHMDALFQGAVLRDGDGCLRLDTPERPTVVWPKDYGFEVTAGRILILDDGGDPVGRVGEGFRLGGGEVPSLHEGLAFTQADRDLAEAQCPGIYWIVAPD